MPALGLDGKDWMAAPTEPESIFWNRQPSMEANNDSQSDLSNMYARLRRFQLFTRNNYQVMGQQLLCALRPLGRLSIHTAVQMRDECIVRS